MLSLRETPSQDSMNHLAAGSRMPSRKQTKSLPLLLEQEQIWDTEKNSNISPANITSAAFVLEGQCDSEALKSSIAEVMNHHKLLTINIDDDGKPAQVFRNIDTLNIPFVEKTYTKPTDVEWIRQTVAEEFERKFNLTEDFPIRVKLVHLDPTKHLLIISVHRIAADAASFLVIQSEISAFYNMYTKGKKEPAKVNRESSSIPLPEQIPDQILKAQLEFWRQNLAGISPIGLSGDKASSPAVVHHAHVEHMLIPEEISQTLVRIGEQNQSNLFNIFLSAVQSRGMKSTRWCGLYLA
ncbi:hypothetical protein K7432_015454 [Basidiobolus ranarum]|uniref:Condensation domain-containing protein n=1 Tax=Basidiobolus ranarum TaxID=34480 RepID=A0ABR2WG42_9FUNG